MTNSTLTPAYRGPARITLATALGALFLAGPMAASAHAVATVPPLATTSAFSVLAGTTVTNTGPTTDRPQRRRPSGRCRHRQELDDGRWHRAQADAVAQQAKQDLVDRLRRCGRTNRRT